jgi:hypothetical protein
MNTLSIERRAQIIAMLTEGQPARHGAYCRCSFNTMSKRLLDVGAACTEHRTARYATLAARRSTVRWDLDLRRAKGHRDEFDVGDVLVLGVAIDTATLRIVADVLPPYA